MGKKILITLIIMAMTLQNISLPVMAEPTEDKEFASEIVEEETGEEGTSTSESENESNEEKVSTIEDEEESTIQEIEDLTDIQIDKDIFDTVKILSNSNFTSRTTCPETSNGYYFSTSNPFYPDLAPSPGTVDSLGNCTWYAWGRAYEILGARPNLSIGWAGNWYSYNKNNGYYSYNSSTPKVGAIACWSNHVAVVERINSNGTIMISESSYVQYSGIRFRTRDNLLGSSPNNGSDTFYGYIYIGDFSQGSNPRGCIDGISGGINSFSVSGWAFDDDEKNTPLQINVYCNGNLHSCIQANIERTDVNSKYPGVGNNHGFNEVINTSLSGNVTVSLWAINVGGGDDTFLGEKTINIQKMTDTSAPTVVSADITSFDKNGYTITAKATDNVGVTRFKFSTWIAGDTSTKVYEIGSISNGQCTYRVNASDFGNREGDYYSDVRAYDACGNESGYYPVGIRIDRTLPTVVSADITSFDKNGYTITAKATDNVGVTRFKFSTWIAGDTSTKVYEIGSISNGQCTYRVNVSDFGNREGDYYSDVRAYDACGNESGYYPVGIHIDRTSPSISEVQIQRISNSKYRVLAKIIDSSTIEDIYTESIVNDKMLKSNGVKNDDLYTFTVDASELDNLYGSYVTTIYAKDNYGNSASFTCDAQQMSENEGYYIVTYDSRGGTECLPAYVKSGKSIGELPFSEKDNYLFGGWYLNEECTGSRFTTSAKVTKNITLFAKWVAPVSVGEYVIGQIEDCVYTGKAIQPMLVIKDGDYFLKENVDYTLSYRNNTKVSSKESNIPPTVIITGKGNYQKVSKVYFSIVPKDIADTDITIECPDISMEKTDISKPIVKWETVTLKENVDYQLEYAPDPDDANGKVVTIEGIGNYTGIRKCCYRIADKMIENAKVVVASEPIYTGSAVQPELTVTYQGENLIQGTDYRVENRDNVNAGKGSITIYGLNQYAGEKSVSFTIQKKALTEETIGVSEVVEQKYTGQKLFPEPIVTDGSRVLEKGKDYTVTYVNNVKAAFSTDKKAPVITIIGIGNYTGKRKTNFSILAKEISSQDIIVSVSDVAFNGSRTKKPSVSVLDNGKKLVVNRDYMVQYSELTEPGTASITLTGKGNYSASRQDSYRIADQLINKAQIKAVEKSVYDGEPQRPEITVTYGNGKNRRILQEYDEASNTGDYTIEYYAEDSVSAGKAKLTVYGKNEYAGSKTVAYTIAARKLDDSITIVPVENQCYTGYVLKPVPSVKNGDMTLIFGKDYTLKYSNNKEATQTGKKAATITVIGKGNYKGTKSATFSINKCDISSEVLSISIPDMLYNKGKSITPSIIVKKGSLQLKKNKDYKVTFINNQDVGEKGQNNSPTAIITGKGNYIGEITESFRIYESKISTVVCDSIPAQSYSGKEIKPSLIVRTGKGTSAVQLLEGIDYELQYRNNVKVGKAKVIIIGKGRYGGTKEVTFKIIPKSVS